MYRKIHKQIFRVTTRYGNLVYCGLRCINGDVTMNWRNVTCKHCVNQKKNRYYGST